MSISAHRSSEASHPTRVQQSLLWLGAACLRLAIAVMTEDPEARYLLPERATQLPGQMPVIGYHTSLLSR